MSQGYAAPGQLWLLPQSEQEGLDFDYRQVLDVVERAYCSLREHGSNNPVKTIIEDPDDRSLSYSMVARDAGTETVCFKAVYEFDPSRKRDSYRFHSFIFIADDTTGAPIALMDVVKLGPLRSSASSALFARAACPDARSALVIGTGVQGQMALPMLLAALPNLERLQVCGTYAEGLRAVQDSVDGREVEIVDDLQKAAGEADILIGAAGLSVQKVVQRDWVKPGAIAVLLGYGVHDVFHGADYRIATDITQMHVTCGKLRAADGSLPPVDAELPDILLGRASARRDSDDVVFAYNSGMAVTDAALGRYIADLALAAGRGQRVDFW
ncbi:ornithine cyclodeaminase family protein [Solwaraspora sp. WMMD406]|uniref:ornithine cyclodeaminase family protein n=1 Tax=Solwaraspora sp. WMMD406 TaxID=3016095 RepID=UPI00241619C9|nr:ornithine cyclodeaminase family protein [Solwaraspora sp. WMMD406]MDG4764929.1 ornithine cyclodeaminase family protein [Solwaraspora sp. WMMD406]